MATTRVASTHSALRNGSWELSGVELGEVMSTCQHQDFPTRQEAEEAIRLIGFELRSCGFLESVDQLISGYSLGWEFACFVSEMYLEGRFCVKVLVDRTKDPRADYFGGLATECIRHAGFSIEPDDQFSKTGLRLYTVVPGQLPKVLMSDERHWAEENTDLLRRLRQGYELSVSIRELGITVEELFDLPHCGPRRLICQRGFVSDPRLGLGQAGLEYLNTRD